jgi:hypothetical protein
MTFGEVQEIIVREDGESINRPSEARDIGGLSGTGFSPIRQVDLAGFVPLTEDTL